MTSSRRPAGPDAAVRGPRTKRWGLRTLGWLALALVSVLASNWFYAQGVTDFVLATVVGTIVGFVGAAWCSVRGLQSWNGLGRG